MQSRSGNVRIAMHKHENFEEKINITLKISEMLSDNIW